MAAQEPKDVPSGAEGPDPYARILQLQAQILQLQAQLLQNPTRPSEPSASGPETTQLVPPPPIILVPPVATRESDTGEAPVPDFPKEESPKYTKRGGNIATISFPEHRLSVLNLSKSRIEMDTRARVQIGALIVDGHVDVVVKAMSSSALAAALKMIDSLSDDEDEFSTATWRSATHSPTSSMLDMRTSTTLFDIPHTYLDPNSRAEVAHLDPDSSIHSTCVEKTPEFAPMPLDDREVSPLTLTPMVGNQFIKSGPLDKKGGGLRSWQKRFFGLSSSSLVYFKLGEAAAKGGMVLTRDSSVVAVNSNDKTHKDTEFILYEGVTKDNYFHLHAGSESERKEWMVALQHQIDTIKADTRFDGRCGALELYLWFEEECSTVHVSVLRARGLPMLLKGDKKLLSPYVKLCVKPYQKLKTKKKTAVAKGTQDPVWNASFDFVLDSALTSQALVLTVMNKGTGKDTVIAKVEYPLLNVACDRTEAQQTWVPLGSRESVSISARRSTTTANNDDKMRVSFELPIMRRPPPLESMDFEQVRKVSTSTSTVARRQSDMPVGGMLRTTLTTVSKQPAEETALEEDLGDLELSLWFEQSASTLHVRVVKGRGLVVKDVEGKSQPTNALVKLEVQPKVGKALKKKTVIVHDSIDPVWNEDFVFVLDEAITTQTLFVRVLNIDKKLTELGGLEISLVNVTDTSDSSPEWYSLLPTVESFVPLPVATYPATPASPTSGNIKKNEFPSSSSTAETTPSTQDEDFSLPRRVVKSPAVKRRERVSVAMIRKAFKSDEPKENKAAVAPPPPAEPLKEYGKQAVDLGAIKIGAWYDADAEKLLVEVIECIGLPSQNKSLPSPYIEVKTLPSELTSAVYRTKRRGKTLNPQFNEQFEFPISKDKCAFRTLALSVFYASGRFGKDKIMGEVLISLEDVPRSTMGAIQTHPLCQASSTVFELNHLGDILFLEAGFESFLSCVTKEHSNENLLFWREVQDFHLKYRDATFDQRQECMADCCEIFYKYIDSGGDCEINIPPSIKAQIRAELTEEKQSDDITRPCQFLAVIYDQAQTEVLDMMSKDSFARYLASKEWEQFKTFLKEECAERDLGFKVINQIADFNQVGKNRTSVIAVRGASSPGRRSSSLAQHRRNSNLPRTRSTVVDPSPAEAIFASAGFVDETLPSPPSLPRPNTMSSLAPAASSLSSSFPPAIPQLSSSSSLPPTTPPLPSSSSSLSPATSLSSSSLPPADSSLPPATPPLSSSPPFPTSDSTSLADLSLVNNSVLPPCAINT